MEVTQDNAGEVTVAAVDIWVNETDQDVDEVDPEKAFYEFTEWIEQYDVWTVPSVVDEFEWALDRLPASEEAKEAVRNQDPSLEKGNLTTVRFTDREEKVDTKKLFSNPPAEPCVAIFERTIKGVTTKFDPSVGHYLVGSDLRKESLPSGNDTKTVEKARRYRGIAETNLVENTQQLSDDVFRRLDSAFRDQVWPDGLQKDLTWAEDDDVTTEMQEWVDAVAKMEDPVFDDYDDLPMGAGLRVKEVVENSLTQPQGWSLDSVDDRLRKEFDYLDPDTRQMIARTEVASVLNRSKRVMLETKSDPSVRWVGPEDSSETELCTWLREETADGVSFEKFLELFDEAVSRFGDRRFARRDSLIPHIGCRHTVEEV